MLSLRSLSLNSKTNLRSVLAVALWIALLPTLSAAQETRELRLASDDWPPFTAATGQLRIATALVETALERAGIESTTTIVDWKDVESGIRRAEFDGSAAMWRTEKRARELFFSDAYLENRLVLVGRKGSDVSATKLSELAGKRVAAVGRYAYGQEVESAVGVIFVNSQSDQDSLDKLLAGDVEFMLVDELVARHLMTDQPDETSANLEIGTRLLARRTLHLAIRRDVPGAREIIDAFNTEIQGMLADGTYAATLQVGWIKADIDGDGLDELVTLGDRIGQVPPGSIYDVFGEEPETPPEEQRIFIAGDVYEGWDAVPDQYKGPSDPMAVTQKYGTTLFTLKF